jgi:hypothetical protein
MDLDLIFLKRVRATYSLDEVLTPRNLGNGELENVLISILRKKLDFCFVDMTFQIIEDIDFLTDIKEKFIDYIEDYSL